MSKTPRWEQIWEELIAQTKRGEDTTMGFELACERIAELEAALRDLLACRGRSIVEIMDHNDNALNRARAVLKGKGEQGG